MLVGAGESLGPLPQVSILEGNEILTWVMARMETSSGGQEALTWPKESGTVDGVGGGGG